MSTHARPIILGAAALTTAAAAIAATSLAPVTASAEPGTATVCGETASVVAQQKREIADLSVVIWMHGDHGMDAADNINYVGDLRYAIANDKILEDYDFNNLADGLNIKAEAAAIGLRSPPLLHADKMAWQRAMFARMNRITLESLRVPEDDLHDRYERLVHQLAFREQRLADLHCDALPTTATSSANGALRLAKSERLQQDRRQNYNAIVYQEYKYSDNSAELIIQNDPPDRRQVRWTFDGVPGSLNPGDEVRITITGQFNLQPPGSEMGANYSAGVRVQGLDQVSAQNAYLYQGKSGDGLFVYRVPAEATKVVIEIGADNGLGIFQRNCYGACLP
jgi:hypothetical protein